MGVCLRDRMTNAGLLPPADPVVAEAENLEPVGQVATIAPEVDTAIAEPELDVTPPATTDIDRAVAGNVVTATFGLLRAEPDGSVVIAGSGTPGTQVEVYSNGELIGTVTVEASGDWVLVPDQPISPGGSEITLAEVGREGRSAESIVVVINEDRSSEPLVVASTPGEASDILQGGRSVEDRTQLAATDPVGGDEQPERQEEPLAAVSSEPGSASPDPVPSGEEETMEVAALPDPLTPDVDLPAVSAADQEVPAETAASAESDVATAVEPEGASEFGEQGDEENTGSATSAPTAPAEVTTNDAGQADDGGELADVRRDPTRQAAVETDGLTPEVDTEGTQDPAGGSAALTTDGGSPDEPTDAQTNPVPAAAPSAPDETTPEQTEVSPANDASTDESAVNAETEQARITDDEVGSPAIADAGETAPEPQEEVAVATANPEEPTSEPTMFEGTAPTIDAIEIEGDRTFFAGAGPEGGIVRLYVDNSFVADTIVRNGRWLAESGNVLAKPSQRVRVDLLEPGSADVLARAEVDFVVELPEENLRVAEANTTAEPATTTGSGEEDASSTEGAAEIALDPEDTPASSSTDGSSSVENPSASPSSGVSEEAESSPEPIFKMVPSPDSAEDVASSSPQSTPRAGGSPVTPTADPVTSDRAQLNGDVQETTRAGSSPDLAEDEDIAGGSTAASRSNVAPLNEQSTPRTTTAAGEPASSQSQDSAPQVDDAAVAAADEPGTANEGVDEAVVAEVAPSVDAGSASIQAEEGGAGGIVPFAASNPGPATDATEQPAPVEAAAGESETQAGQPARRPAAAEDDASTVSSEMPTPAQSPTDEQAPQPLASEPMIAAAQPQSADPAAPSQSDLAALQPVPEQGLGDEVSVEQATAEQANNDGGVPTMVAVAIGDPEAQRFASGKAIIRRGDNLWTIARRVYGEGMKYTTIYQANTGQIRDPDRIYPGQVFELPAEIFE
jgi:nucleoid-associated protein YgaU